MDIATTIILITSGASAVVSIVNAFAAGWGREATRNAKNELVSRAETTDRKLDIIHDSTNGNLSKVTAALDASNAKIAVLEKLVSKMVTPDSPIQSRERTP